MAKNDSLEQRQRKMRGRNARLEEPQTEVVSDPDEQTSTHQPQPTAHTQACQNQACGKKTDNPLFCSQACAAVVHAQSSSTLKGECKRCWRAIRKNALYCRECSQFLRDAAETNKAELQRRRKENYKSWLNLSGERVDGPVRQVSVSTRFTTGVTFRCQDKIGDLIDHLIGLCFSRPPYLTKVDAARYITMLNEFCNFIAVDYSNWREVENKRRVVADMQITQVFRTIEQWVNAYLHDDDAHPMMPIYAMDTGRFIEEHVSPGYGWGDDDCSLEPLISKDDRREAWDRQGQPLFDKSFRTYFTRRWGPRVLCKVPPHGTARATDYRDGKIFDVFAPGDTFQFTIRRCHLSESLETGTSMTCTEPRPQFDLMEEFRFYGTVLVPDMAGKLLEARAYVPGNWITHAIVGNSWDEKELPVPRWSLDESEEHKQMTA